MEKRGGWREVGNLGKSGTRNQNKRPKDRREWKLNKILSRNRKPKGEEENAKGNDERAKEEYSIGRTE